MEWMKVKNTRRKEYVKEESVEREFKKRKLFEFF